MTGSCVVVLCKKSKYKLLQQYGKQKTRERQWRGVVGERGATSTPLCIPTYLAWEKQQPSNWGTMAHFPIPEIPITQQHHTSARELRNFVQFSPLRCIRSRTATCSNSKDAWDTNNSSSSPPPNLCKWRDENVPCSLWRKVRRAIGNGLFVTRA